MAGPMEQIFVEETDELLGKSISELRDLITAEGLKHKIDVTKPRSDAQLLKFIRGKKFDVNRAFKTLCSYEQFVEANGFHDIKREGNVAKMLDCGLMDVPFGVRDKEGRQIAFFYAKFYQEAIDLSIDENGKLDPKISQKAVWYLLDLLISDEDTQRKGVTWIIDSNGFSIPWSQIGALIKVEGAIAKIMQDRFPIRLGFFYMVRENWLFRSFWRLVSVFLKEKLRRRCLICGNEYTEILKRIDAENLPPEFGGTMILRGHGEHSEKDFNEMKSKKEQEEEEKVEEKKEERTN